MEIYPVLLLMAGIVAMDTTSGPQVLVSEPVVSCTLLGFLYGAPETGLAMGILFQLLWIGYLPLGAVRFTANNIAAFIATASLLTASELFGFETVHQKAALIPAMLFGVIVGVIGSHLRDYERRLNGVRSDRLIALIEQGGQPSILWSIFAGAGTAFIKGVVMTLLFVPIGALLCGTVRYMHPVLVESMSTGSVIIWGAVSASAIMFYRTKGRYRFLISGVIGGFIWILFNIV